MGQVDYAKYLNNSLLSQLLPTAGIWVGDLIYQRTDDLLIIKVIILLA